MSGSRQIPVAQDYHGLRPMTHPGMPRVTRRVTKPGGAFLASELHPYRHLLGRQARFSPAGEEGSGLFIQAYPHTIAEFANGAIAAGLRIVQMEEAFDASGEPRLFSLVAMKP